MDRMDLINRYLDGELDREEEADFEKRLRSEPLLRTYIDDMRALAASADTLKVFKAPKINFLYGSRPHYDKIKFREKSFSIGAVLAAACILIGIGIGKMIFNPPDGSGLTERFRIIYYAPGAGSVSVLGDFNGWAGEIPLEPRGEEGFWLTELNVKPGEYKYVLIVDGKERTGDPLADYVIDDDFGSKNSVVRVGL